MQLKDKQEAIERLIELKLELMVDPKRLLDVRALEAGIKAIRALGHLL